MPHFSYKGRGARGDLVQGVLEAMSREAVAGQLLNSGITPVEIAERVQTQDFGATLRKVLRRRRPDLSEIILFCRQMYTLMRAGVPINQAMTGLIRSSRNPVLGEALMDVKSHLEAGRELSAALAQHGEVFSSLFVNTVRIGENTGRLDEAFIKLAEYLDRERDTRARIKSALRYPMFVVIAITAAIAIINIKVVPQFAKMFERAHVDLPIFTKIIIATSNFFVAWWPHLLAALVAAGFWFNRWVKTESGRFTWDRYKLKIPIVGDIVYRATLGRFARGFSMSIAAGVPLIQALTVMSRAVDNEYIGERIRNIRTGVERGDSLTRSAAATGMFTPLVLQMLTVGEETGAVDDLLAEVAGFYEREVDFDVKNLSQTIEPVLIVLLAGLVLVFALGVFLPIWDLASVKLGGAH
ncbi:MAG: type II secretion system F family protein [Gammaproteobacteria bacterium]|nr:type II secretion system F family protein [Gammaproteobacteria bacterium]MBI5617860.1 type II secretion system F family protein [Gammaproteobacteria bacterium]